jgi:hypothetical protein
MLIPLKISLNRKALAGLLSLALLLSALASCISDPDVDYGMGEYYVEIVTALGNSTFLLDNGQTIRDSDKTAQRTFAADARVYLSFSYGKSPDDPITVHGAAQIFSDLLKSVPEATLAQRKQDPVRLESIWTGSHYLNLKFYMDYRAAAHRLALLADENLLTTPEVHLYFSHDKNNDSPGFPTPLYASFDLSKILGEPQGDRTLLIHFNTTSDENKILSLNY